MDQYPKHAQLFEDIDALYANITRTELPFHLEVLEHEEFSTNL